MLFIRVLLIAVLIFMTGCTIQAKHEVVLASKAKEHQLTESFGYQFDSAYKQKGVDFLTFKTLYVAPLNLSDVEVFEHRQRTSIPRLKPWALSEKDKAYYKTQYEKAAIKHLGDSELFVLVDNAADSELRLQAAITEIEPLGTKVEQQTQRMKSYSEGFGRMTMVFELYQGETLLAVVSDNRELGHLWEENNRLREYRHVKRGLNTWLKRLADAINN